MSPSALHGPGAVRGIEGLRGRPPIGFSLTLGLKTQGGGFGEKTHIHFMTARAQADGLKRPHPDFRSWNNFDRNDRGSVDKRRVVHGKIAHHSAIDFFDFNRKAQFLPGWAAQPHRMPVCVGDGKDAMRWHGVHDDPKAGEFKKILCPGDKCQFAMESEGMVRGRERSIPAPCKGGFMLIFQCDALVVGGRVACPSMLGTMSSRGRGSVANAYGFVEWLTTRLMAAGAGKTVSCMGFPFAINWNEAKNARGKWPYYSFAPLMDPAEFFRRQQDMVSMLPDGAPARIEDLSADELADDWAALNPGPVEKPRKSR